MTPALLVSLILAQTPTPDPALSVEEHVATARVEWTKLAELLLDRPESCVDGRDEHAVVGTPGGDAGEFLLALAALEGVRGEPLEDAEIERLFDAYLDAFGGFYLHTDEHALHHAKAEMAKVPELARYAKRIRHDLPAPPRAIRDAVLDHLVRPDNVGCGHLRLMLKHPDDYLVRRSLVQTVLRGYFERLFDGQPGLEFVVLEGGHAEAAVVTVLVDRDVESYSSIPTIVPRHAGTQVFVYHPQVAAYLRHQEARFLLDVHDWLVGHDVDAETMYQQIAAIAAVQLDATLGHLAEGLPVFEVRFFPRDRHHETIPRGRVEGL